MAGEITEVFHTAAQELDAWQKDTFANGIGYTLLYAAVVGAITFVIIKLLNRFFRKKGQGNLRFFFRLIDASIILVAAFTVLTTVKPLRDLGTTLLAGSGLVAVVVGLAAQAALANVFSGISIGVSKPFVIGEQIEIVGQNISGVVTEISLRQTVIRDFNNKRIAVPNSVIDKEIIRTAQLAEQRAIRNFLPVSVGYDTDVEKAIAILQRAVLSHKDFYDTRTEEDVRSGAEKSVDVLVVNLGPASVDLRASVWSRDAATGFAMLCDLRRTIAKFFETGELTPPYDSQKVWVCGEQP